MGTFRTLTEADVRQILTRFGIDEYRAHAAIAVGTINTNIRVETARGPRFVRINEGKLLAEVEREAAIVAHIAARGVSTPVPATSVAGKPYGEWSGSYVSLFPWVPGRTLQRDELTPDHARQVGRALAGLHVAGADFPDRRPGRYEPDEIARRLAYIKQVAGGDDELRDAVATLEPELGALAGDRISGVPLGLIHGDLFVDNVMFDEAGHMTALLDFEQASWGRLIYDVAVTLLAFGFGREDFRDDVTRAFIAGYAAVRPLDAKEKQAFGAELRFAACRFTVTRITDIHLRPAGSGAPPGKNFRRYLQRLHRVRERLAKDDPLLTI
jgi:homoserine kinase type II